MDKEEIIERLASSEVRQEYHIKATEDLKKIVEIGFSNLNCSQNEAKLNEIHSWYTEHKDTMKHAKRVSITATLTAFFAVLMHIIKEFTQ